MEFLRDETETAEPTAESGFDDEKQDLEPSSPKAFHNTPRVVVVGASGYLGSHIVASLLDAKCDVSAIVRDPHNLREVEHLLALPKGPEQTLVLVKADLKDPNYLERVFEGAKYVLHADSSVVSTRATRRAVKSIALDAKARSQALVDSAVEAVQAILHAAKKCNVLRVCLTSSMEAVVGHYNERGACYTYSEADWNTSATLEKYPHALSKKLSEEEAWKLSEELTLDVVVINPGFMMGPPLADHKALRGSVDFMRELTKGGLKDGVPQYSFTMSDVRDVAQAHVTAMLQPYATGRYICAHKVDNLLDVLNLLKPEFSSLKVFPDVTVSADVFNKDIPGLVTKQWLKHFVKVDFALDISKYQNDLELRMRPLKATMVDTLTAMLELQIFARDGGRRMARRFSAPSGAVFNAAGTALGKAAMPALFMGSGVVIGALLFSKR